MIDMAKPGTRWAASLAGKQHAEQQLHDVVMHANDVSWLSFACTGTRINWLMLTTLDIDC